MFTRCGICCVLAIFERRRGGLGSKISGCDQLAEVAVYFAMSGLPPEERAGWVRRSRNPPTGLRRCDGFRLALPILYVLPSFRDGPKDQTRNLEIPGSVLRTAPE
jgi:hypothetical protein